MPVWHEATRRWVEDGRLVLLGLAQEQHPERCRLFAQWQNFDWPIAWDPINWMESIAVPIVVAIDEHGIVRSVGPDPETFEEEFLNQTFADDAPELATLEREPPDPAVLEENARGADTALAWRDLGDVLTLWGGPQRLDDALHAYRRATELDPQDGNAHFRLGVVYRMRYETEHAHPGDLQASVDLWEQAQSLNPNQYIWRRRIQQYGPRLDKPYPFYDWTAEATREISGRGETPVALAVPPYGAEIASPAREFPTEAAPEEPPGGAFISRDEDGLIRVETAVVPSHVEPGGAARVHVTFRPNPELKTHWNNEAGVLKLWVEPPQGWQVSRRLLATEPVPEVETKEVRRLDFEVKAPVDARGVQRLSGYAVYFVCEDLGGSCRFLRQDIEVELQVETP